MNKYETQNYTLAEKIYNTSRKALYATAAVAYILASAPSQSYGYDATKAKIKVAQTAHKAKEGLKHGEEKVKNTFSKTGKKLKQITGDKAENAGEQIGSVIISIPTGFVHGVKKAVIKTPEYKKGTETIQSYFTEEGRRQRYLDEKENQLYQEESKTADLVARLNQVKMMTGSGDLIEYQNPETKRIRDLLYKEVTKELRQEIYNEVERQAKKQVAEPDQKTIKEISDVVYAKAEKTFRVPLNNEINAQAAQLMNSAGQSISKRSHSVNQGSASAGTKKSAKKKSRYDPD